MIINHCTIYRKDTGEIFQYSNFSCGEDAHLTELNYKVRLAVLGSEEYAILKEQSDYLTQYVAMMADDPVLIDRPSIPYEIDKTFIMADGVDFCTISGLHDPCDVVIDDPDPLVETTTTTVTGGSFQFSANTAGTYTIQIARFPFLPMTLEIMAVNPEAPDTASFSPDFSYEFGQ